MPNTELDNRVPLVKMINITKRFGGLTAVQDVDLELYEGEVLALVGDNAAGKSTLIKVLSGAYIADEGEIYVGGKKADIRSPKDARALGIETIYQDLALFENMSIPPNVFIGREKRHKGILGLIGVLDVREMKSTVVNLLDNFGIEIKDVNMPVKNLSGGQRQMVAISRAVYFNAKVIVMDEPTAALGVAETRKVYAFVEGLKKTRIGVIIISHNINEVFTIADRFMVLKSGFLVGVKTKKNASMDDVVKLILAGKYE